MFRSHYLQVDITQTEPPLDLLCEEAEWEALSKTKRPFLVMKLEGVSGTHL
jgi:hypothetical protein